MTDDKFKKKIDEWELKTKLAGKDKELQETVARAIGIPDLEEHNRQSQAARRNHYKVAKHKIDVLLKTGNLKASIHKTYCYLLKFGLDHGVDVMSISHTGIAYYSNQSRKSVIDSIRWLERNNFISLGLYPGVKGKPQKITINHVAQWFQNKQN